MDGRNGDGGWGALPCPSEKVKYLRPLPCPGYSQEAELAETRHEALLRVMESAQTQSTAYQVFLRNQRCSWRLEGGLSQQHTG